MADWKTYRLSEICEVNPETRNRNWLHTKIEYIDISSVGSGQFIESPKMLSLKDAPSRAQRIVRSGDIIVSTVRPNRRSFLYLKEAKPETIASTGFAILRAKENNDSRFLYYLVTNQEFTDYLVSKAEGSAYPAVNPSIFSNADVLVPDYKEQKAIAKILSSLDDKIELNRRMNATLEAMAKALFRAWFVDFEPVRANLQRRPSESALPEIAKLFPSEFKETEIGVIPKEWDFQSVYDSARFLNGLAFKQNDFSGENRGMPIIKIVELKNGISTQTQFTEKIFDDNYRVSNEDILFSWSGSPETSIDIFLWIGTDGWLNQHIFKVFPKSNSEREFIYFLLREFKGTFISIAKNKQTTGLGHVTAKDLKRLQFVLPSQRIIDCFKNELSPIYDLKIVNEKEIQTLSKIRDSLLPRLVSGKIRIGTAENEIEAAI